MKFTYVFLIIISISLVSSLSVDIPVPINYSLIPTVNNSEYWDGNAWSDTRWLDIDGGNANQDIDIGTYNFTANYFFGNGSQLTGINFSPYWKSDGTSTASGNWDIGDYSFDAFLIHTPSIDSIIGGAIDVANMFLDSVSGGSADIFNSYFYDENDIQYLDGSSSGRRIYDSAGNLVIDFNNLYLYNLRNNIFV